MKMTSRKGAKGQRWREWNERRSREVWRSLFVIENEDSDNAFRKHPYAWWWLFAPIVGIAGFYGVYVEENHERRSRELREKRAEREALPKAGNP